MLHKLFSYFIPINIYKKKSSISETIEVTWNNGELVIDSKNTNYSYGSLQRILRKGLKYIGFERIKKFDNVLLLGVAGGSVIKTLVEEIKFKGKITGVEIDPAMIERIEIIRGANAIQGMGASGGIINIITKKTKNAPMFTADVFSTSWLENNVDLGFKTNIPGC